MIGLSVYVKLTEQETEEFKKKILKDKKLITETTLSGVSLLQIAIIHGNTDLGKFLIDQGIDVNHQDKKGLPHCIIVRITINMK